MLNIPNKPIEDLRDYIGLSQNLQQLILKKEFKKIDTFFISINIVEKNKFLLIQLLRQTFPHRKNILSWDILYNNSIKKLNISEIKSFS